MPRPAYGVTFRNLSEKSIAAVRVDMMGDGRPAVSHFFQGKEGQALIEVGGVSEQYVSALRTERTPTAYVPGTASANVINIRTLVFSDLSFEGDVQPACDFEMFVMGRRIWLRHVVASLDQEITKPNSDQIAAAKQLKEKLSVLSYDPTESERNQASVVSPKCSKPFAGAYVAIQGQKLQLLRDLDQIIETRPVPPVNFRQWLVDRRARYQAWLSRL